jgi:lipid-binding SYLF domain-containing protein
LKSKFTRGGDASVAAGPVGREATAKTDGDHGCGDSVLVARQGRLCRSIFARRHPEE